MDRIALRTDQPDGVIADPERLRALAATGLLDTSPEQAYDRLTRLAARLTGAPVTFLSLVDRERDFYKSHCGFNEPLASTRQLDGRTFCHYALVSDGPLVIEDVTAHPLFRDVPTVASLSVRAYAGIPLVLDDGQVIGSFCAIDFIPRPWSELDIETLQELANATLREISLRRLVNEAQQSARAREAILTVLEHDLPNTLNLVTMALHALEDADASAQAGLLADARLASNAVNDTLNNLLEFSRMQAGRINLRRQDYDATGLLQDAVAILEPTAARRGIALDLDTTPVEALVTVDYQYLLRALCQLIGHAVRISPDGGRVQLALARSGGAVRFAFVDQGPKLVPDAFDYAKPDAAQRGSRLELSMAKALIEVHGGRIWIEPTTKPDNLVHFTLPAKTTAA